MYKTIQSYPFYRFAASLYPPQEHTKKHLILEPLSCVLRIILLQYKDKGTKISIINNGISYNNPTIAQGFLRSWYGDTREDLHNICNPLIYFTRWYPKVDPQFNDLYTECEKGFISLKGAYDTHSTIHHTINHYVSLLKGETTEDISPPSTYNSSENPIIGRFQNIWSKDEITLLVHLLSLLKCQPKDREVYLRNLEDILDTKEHSVHEYIREIISGY